MEPNPSTFLRAMRRELLSSQFFGAGIESGASFAIAHRSAEAMVQMLLRREKLPALLRDHLPEKRRLLGVVADRLTQLRLATPGALQSALSLASASSSASSECEVELHDAITEGLAGGIRVLRECNETEAAAVDFLNDLCRQVAASEHALRSAAAAQLKSLREETADAAAEVAALPTPTDAQLEAYLRDRFREHPGLTVGNVRRLVGDNSKEIFFFDVDNASGLNGCYVMRREPVYNVTKASLADEFELLTHLHQHGIPVPRALAAEKDLRHFDAGFIITSRVPGATRTPAELGTRSEAILKEIARMSAQIHRVDIPRHLPQFADAELTTRDRMQRKIDAMYRRWLDERSEDSVIVETAYQWLRTNASRLDDVAVLTHGDYSLRNILIEDDRLSSVLDWELCRVSHPAEDLAYIRAWVESVMPWDDYLAEYRAHAPHPVSDFALYYFAVWARFWNVVIAASVYSGYMRNEHRNFVFLSVACVEYRDCLDYLVRLIADAPVD